MDADESLNKVVKKERRTLRKTKYCMKSKTRNTTNCRVCSRPHAGVTACRECLKFHRGAVLTITPLANCGNPGSCNVHFKHKMCDICRLRKCQENGLSILSVKMFKRRRMRRPILPARTPLNIRAACKAYCRLFSSYDRNIRANHIKPLLLSDEPLEKCISTYKASMFSQFCSFYQPLVNHIVQFSKKIPGFSKLPADDQLILLKTGFIDVWLILNSARLTHVKDSITLFDGTQIPICEVTTVYTKEYVTSMMELSDESRTLQLTIPEKALLISLAISCPERPNLLEQEQVRSLQSSLMDYVKDYIQLSSSADSERYDKLSGFISNVYDVGKQHSLLLNVYRADVDKLECMFNQKMAETGAGDTSSPEADHDFEPTADHLVHDYDDEGTMEEEENLSSESGDNDELDDLQKESDMPLEALLAMYGYGNADPMAGGDNRESNSSNSEEEILNNHDLTLDKEEVARDVLKNNEGSETSTVDELIGAAEAPSTTNLLNGSLQRDYFDEDEEEEDEDYLPTLDEEVWKKSIQVGDEFQADVPELSTQSDTTVDIPASAAGERLLWDPEVLCEKEVIKYLTECKPNPTNSTTTPCLPDKSTEEAEQSRPAHDDEQALYTLLQSDYNIDEAVRRKQLQTTPPSDPLSLWSEEECQNFESGLRVYGKNFFAIHQNKVRTRSVGELVQFYYFWKKTERREAFCNRGRIEKKKSNLTPGITDYTDRFIERAESDDETSNASLPVDCSCAVEATDDVTVTAGSVTSTNLPTEISYGTLSSDRKPINAHPAFSLNTDNVTSSTDTIQPSVVVTNAGDKRSHDVMESPVKDVEKNGSMGDHLSPAAKKVFVAPDHTEVTASLTEAASSVQVENVL